MEHPRPQPHASYTLIFLLLIAAISQIVGEVIRPIGTEDQEQDFAVEQVNPTRSHLMKVSRFLTWTPKKASAFLPRLFRPDEKIAEEQLVVEEINDDLLINDLSSNHEEIDEEQGQEKLERQSDELADHVAHVPIKKTTQDIAPDQLSSEDLAIASEIKFHSGGDDENELGTIKPNKSNQTQILVKQKNKSKDTRHLLATSSSKTTKQKQSAQRVAPKKSAKDEAKQKDKLINSTISKKSKNTQQKTTANIATSVKSKTSEESPKPKVKKRKRRKRRYTKSGILIHGIEDPNSAMKSFYTKLSTIKAKGSKVRVVHYGDSLIAGDYVTRTVRRLLQKTFGDAGHGFFLSGKGSRWYGRRWIDLRSKGKWIKKRFTKAKKMGREYGLGGVSFTSSTRGHWVKAKATGTSIGAKVDYIELHYLVRPNGGSFKLDFAGQTQELSTASETEFTKTIKIKAPSSGKWEAKITLNGDGKVTLFGFTFERNKGGIVYDSLGLEGARAKLLLNLSTPEWTKQIRRRNPDLYVLHYGTNESVNSRMNMELYKKSLKQVIKRFKRALPRASCLLVSPMDRAKKDEETGKIKSMRIVSKIVSAQREVSLAEGCAFWSTYDAMGGRGSMSRWYNASPKLAGGDLTHPTSSGANRIGAMFFAALMDAYKHR